jgi:hypothetical protein
VRPHPKSLSHGERDFEFWLPSPTGRRVGDEGGSQIYSTFRKFILIPPEINSSARFSLRQVLKIAIFHGLTE